MALFKVTTAAPALLPCIRSFCTSLRVLEGSTPSYVYVPPGSSVSDPAYFSEQQAKTEEAERRTADEHFPNLVSKLSPRKKAVLLKMAANRAPLTPQGGQHYVPSGCSMSDPNYSIKDPVYFVDAKKSSE